MVRSSRLSHDPLAQQTAQACVLCVALSDLRQLVTAEDGESRSSPLAAQLAKRCAVRQSRL
jgi:hypothetical protein